MSFDLVMDSSNYEEKISSLMRVLTNLPADLVKAGADIIEDQMRMEVPVKTGRLQGSITTNIGENEATVSTNTGYGMAVDQGRRGFDLNKGPPGALRFFYNGKIIFRHHVHVGPARANNFKARTVLNSASRIASMLDQTLDMELSHI